MTKKQRKIELIDLIRKLCEINNLSQEQLCMPGKQAKYSQAKALLAFFVRQIDYISPENLVKILGRDAKVH